MPSITSKPTKNPLLPLEQRESRIQPDYKFRTDWINPTLILTLCIFGTFFIYSAQLNSSSSQWKMQIAWTAIAMTFYVTISRIDYKLFLQNAHWIYIFSISVLALTLPFSPFGVTRYGSTRWIDLKFMLFQPTELAKIGTLIMIASVLARSEIKTFWESRWVLLKVALITALPILIIFSQPDLGSALVFPPMFFGLLYICRLSKRFFAVLFGLALLSVAIVGLDLRSYVNYMQENDLSFHADKGKYQVHSFVPLDDYQRNRLLGMVAPAVVDPSGTDVSWNLIQSLISVSSGGFLGKGWQEGTQAKLGYLPQSVAHNDFIFSVIAEEKGFFGSLFVLGVFAIIVINTLRISMVSRDRFGMLLCVGVSIIFLVHILVNIGMTIGLMPITGLPLPFLSYGGSFLVSCCILQALVQSTYRFRKDRL